MKPRTHRVRLHPARQALGWLLLAAGLAASLALASHSLSGKEMPGCGPSSDCGKALSSAWSRVGRWPVSYLAVCYFTGLGAAWLVARRHGVGAFLKVAARGGSLVSLLYLIAAWSIQAPCRYCLVVHAANLLFWLLVETAPKSAEVTRSAMAFAGGFAVLFAVLTVAESENRWQDTAATAEADLASGPRDLDPRIEERAGASSVVPSNSEIATGGNRSRGGLADTPAIRAQVTIYTDYSCPLCDEVDEELTRVAASHPTVEVTVKHYPLCTECNPNTSENLHPNACRAARAAETARLESGEPGFQRLHRWLFRREGEFTDDQLRRALPELGFPAADAFLAAMSSPESLRRVQGDIKLAVAQGVEGTPAIFVNGTALRNWKTGALGTAILQRARVLEERSPADAKADQSP